MYLEAEEGADAGPGGPGRVHLSVQLPSAVPGGAAGTTRRTSASARSGCERPGPAPEPARWRDPRISQGLSGRTVTTVITAASFKAGSVEEHAIESFNFSWRNGWSEA